MKKARTLGIMIGVAAMLTAVLGAGSAYAANFNMESSSGRVTGSTSQSPVLKVQAGAMECPIVNLSGETKSSSQSTLLLRSEWVGGCKAFGFVTATVKTNGCAFVLHANANLSGSLDVACDKSGEKIELIASMCKVTIPAQEGVQSLSFQNLGSGPQRTLSMTAAVQGLTYTASAFCPGGSGTAYDGALTGGWKLFGRDASGNQTGLWIE